MNLILLSLSLKLFCNVIICYTYLQVHNVLILISSHSSPVAPWPVALSCALESVRQRRCRTPCEAPETLSAHCIRFALFDTFGFGICSIILWIRFNQTRPPSARLDVQAEWQHPVHSPKACTPPALAMFLKEKQWRALRCFPTALFSFLLSFGSVTLAVCRTEFWVYWSDQAPRFEQSAVLLQHGLVEVRPPANEQPHTAERQKHRLWLWVKVAASCVCSGLLSAEMHARLPGLFAGGHQILVIQIFFMTSPWHPS